MPRAIEHYVVQPGDGWFSIARKVGVDVERLVVANGSTLHTMLHPGRILVYEAPEAPAPAPIAFAWWAQSSFAAVEAKAELGFTHNVLWSTQVTVEYLDNLHEHGIKAIPVVTEQIAGHPAIAAGIVADEPDLWANGAPKRTVAQVEATAAATRALMPGLPILSTIGIPCAAGPLSATEAESTPAGYWCISAGGVNSNPQADIDRFAAYAAPCDIVCPQMFTSAGDPVKPEYRRAGSPDQMSAAMAGTRRSGFVPAGMARARRLLGDRVEMWALLAPVKYSGLFGTNPTPQDLFAEAQAVVDGGGRGILYFDVGRDGVPREALLADAAQADAVRAVITTFETADA
jgi:hypothetical protein